jgi:hypothetical protein
MKLIEKYQDKLKQGDASLREQANWEELVTSGHANKGRFGGAAALAHSGSRA